MAFQLLYILHCKCSYSDQQQPISYLQFIVDKELSDHYPQFEILLLLFITLPTGISSAERLFSALQRTYIKNYLSYGLRDYDGTIAHP
jgi:hypothetical protein